MILTIIDPQEFTSPLASPNPKIVGNVGERTLQFPVWLFNETTSPFSGTAAPVGAEFGPIEYARNRSLTLAAGEKTQLMPAIVIPIDTPEGKLPDGEYTLRVEFAGAVAEIVVRVNVTDLYLVSAWPAADDVTTTDDVVRAELALSEAKVEQLVVGIAESQDSLKTLQVRIPKLKALLA